MHIENATFEQYFLAQNFMNVNLQLRQILYKLQSNDVLATLKGTVIFKQSGGHYNFTTSPDTSDSPLKV